MIFFFNYKEINVILLMFLHGIGLDKLTKNISKNRS